MVDSCKCDGGYGSVCFCGLRLCLVGFTCILGCGVWVLMLGWVYCRIGLLAGIEAFLHWGFWGWSCGTA